jgi:hypothetical protein
MALRDFWINVRTASRLPAPEVIADSPSFDAASIEQSLRGATSWLSTRAVAGFNPDDFDFLPDAECTKLTDLVAAFRQVASEVKPTAPATDDQVARALPPFRDIVQMLEFDRYGDAEAYRLGKQIERAIESYRPKEIAELRFNTGDDHSGDPALWIWVILTDESSETDEMFLQNARRLRGLLADVAREVAPDRFPYLSFWSLAEQVEVLKAR